VLRGVRISAVAPVESQLEAIYRAAARGEVRSAAVDIPTRPGVTQRVIVLTPESPRAAVVLFAGGTGITAFTAFLDELPPDASQAITLAYGARTRDLLIYRDLVERCVRELPEFNVSYFLETDGAIPGKREQLGRVSVEAMWPLIRRPMDAEYYISGPPAMLRSTGQQLRDRGISSEKIHIDAWE